MTTSFIFVFRHQLWFKMSKIPFSPPRRILGFFCKSSSELGKYLRGFLGLGRLGFIKENIFIFARCLRTFCLGFKCRKVGNRRPFRRGLHPGRKNPRNGHVLLLKSFLETYIYKLIMINFFKNFN